MSVLLFVVPLFAIGLTLFPLLGILTSTKSGCSVKNRFLLHFCMFFGIFLLTAIILLVMGGAAPAAIGACSENPKSFVKAMIFVVLGEGLAIYGLVISFLILFAK